MREYLEGKIVAVAPGEEAPVAEEESNIFPDNRPLSLKEGLQYTENVIETAQRSKSAFEVLMSGNQAQVTPIGEVLARENKIKTEFEQMIAEAEAQEPGSSEPPIPTEEDKKFYEVKAPESS